MLTAWHPERAVTTHHAIVEAVIYSLERRGAGLMVGDNPGSEGYGGAARAAEVPGLRAARALAAVLNSDRKREYAFSQEK